MRRGGGLLQRELLSGKGSNGLRAKEEKGGRGQFRVGQYFLVFICAVFVVHRRLVQCVCVFVHACM